MMRPPGTTSADWLAFRLQVRADIERGVPLTGARLAFVLALVDATLTHRERTRLQHESLRRAAACLGDALPRHLATHLLIAIRKFDLRWRRLRDGHATPRNDLEVALFEARRWGALPTSTRQIRTILHRETEVFGVETSASSTQTSRCEGSLRAASLGEHYANR